jgi:hypothetical protein
MRKFAALVVLAALPLLATVAFARQYCPAGLGIRHCTTAAAGSSGHNPATESGSDRHDAANGSGKFQAVSAQSNAAGRLVPGRSSGDA